MRVNIRSLYYRTHVEIGHVSFEVHFGCFQHPKRHSTDSEQTAAAHRFLQVWNLAAAARSTAPRKEMSSSQTEKRELKKKFKKMLKKRKS